MILIFDTETTGLYPGNVCQLSYIMQNKNGLQAKNFFFTVDKVEYSAFLVHGLSVEKLKTLSNGKRFRDFFYEIESDFSLADLVVSHNTDFDFMFMRSEYENLCKDFIINDSFCTMKKSVPICKLPRKTGASYKYPKLSELCAFLDITDEDILSKTLQIFGEGACYHDARFDTTALFLALNKGIKLDYYNLKDKL